MQITVGKLGILSTSLLLSSKSDSGRKGIRIEICKCGAVRKDLLVIALYLQVVTFTVA
jgi:hypothetical protein